MPDYQTDHGSDVDGVKMFEEETNQNGWNVESFQVGGQGMAVAILKK